MPSTTRSTRLALAVGTLVLGVTATACGGSAGDAPAAAPTTAVAAPTTASDDQTTSPPADDAPPEAAPEVGSEPEQEPQILTARPSTDVALYDDPAAPEPARVLPATTSFGTPVALLVTEVGTAAADGWLRVLVPGRPNGAEAWLRANDVELLSVRHEVHVDLATRTLEVRDGGDLVLSTPVAIGDPEHPTPTGRFSLTDKLDTADPSSPYGPYALGLSGRSDVLTEFAGGDGQIGIHGTNDPSSIGQAVSHGCIRVPNDVVTTLAGMLPLGTPVTVA